jgi:hypothetical protein
MKCSHDLPPHALPSSCTTRALSAPCFENTRIVSKGECVMSAKTVILGSSVGLSNSDPEDKSLVTTRVIER